MLAGESTVSLKIYFHKVLIAFSIFHVIHKAFSNQHQQINVFRLSKRQKKVFFFLLFFTVMLLLLLLLLFSLVKKTRPKNTFFSSCFSLPNSNAVVDRVKGIYFLCSFESRKLHSLQTHQHIQFLLIHYVHTYKHVIAAHDTMHTQYN